jgi:outer membrane protein OmpA-like peptidoglycan-associated protein
MDNACRLPHLSAVQPRPETTRTLACLAGAARALLLAGLIHTPHQAMAISPIASCGTSVEFAANSHALSDSAMQELNRFVTQCETYGRTVVVNGYPDDREEERHGLDLAKARAEAVRRYLLATGIFARSIDVRFDYGVSLSSTSALRRATLTVP